jgi:uncharacterized beta-barrel protein YwiB (DUF1934 family)
MSIPVLITIRGTQQYAEEEPETLEFVTQGEYSYEPGLAEFSYVESEMTGMPGVVTTFQIEDGSRVTLTRKGSVNSTMVFEVGKKHEALYDLGVGGLLLGLCAKHIFALLNERGGIFDLSYTIELEQSAQGVNSYHIEIKPRQEEAS